MKKRFFFMVIMLIFFVIQNSKANETQSECEPFSLKGIELAFDTCGFFCLKSKTGDTWYGLYESEDGFELRETQIYLKDEGLICLSTEDSNDPLFLVRGIERLKIGSTKTLFYGKAELDESSMEFDISGVHYYLFAFFDEMHKPNLPWVPNDRIKNYHLRIVISKSSEEPKYQDVFSFDDLPYGYGEDHMPNIVWVGDLDNDNQLDFLFSQSGSKPGSTYSLFLSNYAKENEIVGKVAEFDISID